MANYQIHNCKRKIGESPGKYLFQIPCTSKDYSKISFASIVVRPGSRISAWNNLTYCVNIQSKQSCVWGPLRTELFWTKLQAELLKYIPKQKILKPGALPTIFIDPSTNEDDRRCSTAKVKKKRDMEAWHYQHENGFVPYANSLTCNEIKSETSDLDMNIIVLTKWGNSEISNWFALKQFSKVMKLSCRLTRLQLAVQVRYVACRHGRGEIESMRLKGRQVLSI